MQTCQKRSPERTEIILPQVNGYNIYKGDFHTHTMYSDARVSPKGRVMEAWLDGLDIVAITDHYGHHLGVKNPQNAPLLQEAGNCIRLFRYLPIQLQFQYPWLREHMQYH